MFIYSGLLVGITAGAHHAAGDIHQSGCISKEPHTKSSFFSRSRIQDISKKCVAHSDMVTACYNEFLY